MIEIDLPLAHAHGLTRYVALYHGYNILTTQESVEEVSILINF